MLSYQPRHKHYRLGGLQLNMYVHHHHDLSGAAIRLMRKKVHRLSELSLCLYSEFLGWEQVRTEPR